MNRITNLTRRDIFKSLRGGFDEDIGFDIIHYSYDFWGELDTVNFLNRLYSLKDLPSKDPRYSNAEEDIHVHTIAHPEDYPEGWLFDDDRFSLKDGSDENLLNFLCEIFHPEVRNETGEWMQLYKHLNELLLADGYEIYCKGQISRRNVYGWRDKTACRFQSVREQDIKSFTKLLIRNGTVIDFYRKEEFDDFTEGVIGVRLCDQYGPMTSKAAALHQFLNDCMDEGVLLKLLSALIKRYEDSQMFSTDTQASKDLYVKCREILDRAINTNASAVSTVRSLQQEFSSEYLSSEMNLMMKMQEENPTEAIGKAKELVESCCRTILEQNAILVDKKWELEKLVSETTRFLKITPEDIPENIPMADTMKKLLGNLRAIVRFLGELRNAYGSGHGKSATYKGLQPRHARLAVGSSLTLVQFLWDSFQYRKFQEARCG